MSARTDRELLELAAKAISLEIAFPITRSGEPYPCRQSDMLPWNPLTDDGDALRLAVKLQITVAHDETGAHYAEWIDEENDCECTIVERDDDHCAATRRAIVGAAAEIGSAK